jgi:hypothetical protein
MKPEDRFDQHVNHGSEIILVTRVGKLMRNDGFDLRLAEALKIPCGHTSLGHKIPKIPGSNDASEMDNLIGRRIFACACSLRRIEASRHSIAGRAVRSAVAMRRQRMIQVQTTIQKPATHTPLTIESTWVEFCQPASTGGCTGPDKTGVKVKGWLKTSTE